MNRCRICGNESDGEILYVREMMQGTEEMFPYFICPHCSCIQILKIPENLETYYSKDYYSYKMPDIEEPEKKELNQKRILDVGCGAGKLLSKMAREGYSFLHGCDPFIKDNIFYKNGVKIYKKAIHEMDGEYDWIFLSDSFEHVTDPDEVMASVKRLLAPDGIVKIKVPVFPNIAYDLLGTHWYQLDAPRHIFIPSKKAMDLLADKHDLQVMKREYDSNLGQIVISYLYSKGFHYKQQNDDIMNQYFTQDILKEFQQKVNEANTNEYGDHAVFYLTHKEPHNRKEGNKSWSIN